MDSPPLDATLAQAREILSSEASFIGHEYAADENGVWKPVGSREAARFSLWGALMRAGANTDILTEARELFSRIAPTATAKLRTGKLTYAETLALLDTALAALGERHSDSMQP